jgi:hypothetical protein
MAIGVQQLQVVEHVLAASTAPNPMVDVPGFALIKSKRLPARHALAALLSP